MSDSSPKAAPSPRLAAIDWMRGFVMILMAIDHASEMWNAGRLRADSAYLPNLDLTGPLWVPGSPLDEAQFYTRWITHLCAPTFLFLSGTSLAMSFEKRRARGMAESELDRHLLIRAVIAMAAPPIAKRAKLSAEPFLVIQRYILIPKQDHQMIKPGLLDQAEGLGIHRLAQINATDFRPQRI